VALAFAFLEYIADRPTRIHSDALTASEILVSHLAWYRLALWGGVALAAFTILCQAGIFLYARQKGRPLSAVAEGVQVISALIVAVVSVLMVWGVPGLISRAGQDLAAIESGELPAITIVIRLDEEHERPWHMPGLTREGHPHTVYRLLLTGEVAEIYFPRGLSPASLRVSAADETYLLSGSADYHRAFLTRYTPNFHLVVSAAPLTDAELDRPLG